MYSCPRLRSCRVRRREGPAYVGAETVEGDDVRLYVQPVQDVQGRTFYFQVGRSIEPEQDAMQRLVVILLAGGFIGLIMAATGGYWLAGLALTPDPDRRQRPAHVRRRRLPRTAHATLADPRERRAPEAPVRISRPTPTPSTTSSRRPTASSYVVGQMLTLARSDVATTDLVREPIAIAHLARDVGRRMQLLASEKNIAVSVSASGSPIVNGDEQRLGELLIVLLDNAIKYTDEDGHVTLSVAQSGDEVRLVITDDGRGIPPDALAHVFDRFYRVDKARSRELGGTGLGLAIAKWIVDTHGGRIAIDSSVGVGTTVTAHLPAEDLQLIADETAASETPV